MAKELAFVFINPYTVRKSRTGGVISRYLVRTDLQLVGARMYGPSGTLAREYARLARFSDPGCPEMGELTAEYVRRSYSPDVRTGRPHRVLCLLFEGEEAIRKIWDITGSSRLAWGSGLTVRDTFGDYVTDDHGRVVYFEPAVLVAPGREHARDVLRLWLRYFASDSGIVRGALDVPGGADAQQALVLLKPDNFRIPSLRAGNIVDLLSSTSARIVGVKKMAMSVEQAMEFYAPVRDSLRRKFLEFGVGRAAQALSREFGFPVDENIVRPLCRPLAIPFAEKQFCDIIEFMTGRRPDSDAPAEVKPRPEECLAIIYEGPDAVGKIREVLGSTDPRKARPGSIRREFGTNIMVNAAHASDSPENAAREMRIVNIEQDPAFVSRIREFYL